MLKNSMGLPVRAVHDRSHRHFEIQACPERVEWRNPYSLYVVHIQHQKRFVMNGEST